jgi:Trk-type K+ transport system membrane component
LIFFGALGFDTLIDLFNVKSMRERLKYPWKRPKVGTMVNIYTTITLVVLGTIAFLIFEKQNSFANYGTVESIITGLFQSITLRTAGFNTLDFSQMAIPTLLIAMIFMFIGGASSSTAGGIKTSTFSILILSAYSVIRRKKHIEVFKRTIPQDIVFRAFSTLMFALTIILIGIIALSISEQELIASEQFRLIDIIFEEVSAFATVGVSTGVTSHLSELGKSIIILSMFVGRVGTLTVVFALSSSIVSTNYKYPDEHMLIG